MPPADGAWLEEAHRRVAEAAGVARIAVALGTERFVAGALRITVLVIGPDGVVLGWQDKVQLDPSEHQLYAPGDGRCRAAENTAWFATVNCAADGAPTTSAIASPDGSLLAFQPHGEAGLLVADLDLELATRELAVRLRAPAG